MKTARIVKIITIITNLLVYSGAPLYCIESGEARQESTRPGSSVSFDHSEATAGSDLKKFIKKKALDAKKFASDHKVAIGVGAVAAALSSVFMYARSSIMSENYDLGSIFVGGEEKVSEEIQLSYHKASFKPVLRELVVNYLYKNFSKKAQESFVNGIPVGAQAHELYEVKFVLQDIGYSGDSTNRALVDIYTRHLESGSKFSPMAILLSDLAGQKLPDCLKGTVLDKQLTWLSRLLSYEYTLEKELEVELCPEVDPRKCESLYDFRNRVLAVRYKPKDFSCMDDDPDVVAALLYSKPEKDRKLVAEILLRRFIISTKSRTRCIETTLNYGASIEAKSGNYANKLRELFKKQGINTDDLGEGYVMNYTALQCAVLQGDKEIVELLLNRGASLEAVNSKGYTALHYAVLQGNKEVVGLLLNRGASLEAVTSEGIFVLNQKDSDLKNIIRLLLEKSAVVNEAFHDYVRNKGYNNIEELLNKHSVS